jgi:hypothetical protein
MSAPSFWFGAPPISDVLAKARSTRDGKLWEMLKDIQEEKKKLDTQQEYVRKQQSSVHAEYDHFTQKIAEAKLVYQQMMTDAQTKHEILMKHIESLQQMASEAKAMANETTQYIQTMRSEWKQEVEKYDEWLREAQIACPLEHTRDDGVQDFVMISQDTRVRTDRTSLDQTGSAPAMTD